MLQQQQQYLQRCNSSTHSQLLPRQLPPRESSSPGKHLDRQDPGLNTYNLTTSSKSDKSGAKDSQ